MTTAPGRPLAVFTDWDAMIDIGPGRALLEGAGWDTRAIGTSDPAAVLEACRGAVAICLGYAHLDAAMLRALPSVRIVSLLATGADTVDLDAARQLGIWVANVVGASTEEVAVHALALSLALVRRLPALEAAVRGGGWNGLAGGPIRRLSTLTLGLIGLGRIGRRHAALAALLYGRIVGHDTDLPVEAWPDGVERLDLDEVFATADVLALHVPLVAGTRHLVDAARLGRMRRGAFLVNVARGDVVDSAALLAALDTGQLGGAALDVLPAEPPHAGDPLVGHARVLVTPHAGFYSVEAAQDYAVQQARNVLAWQAAGRPLNVVVEGRA